MHALETIYTHLFNTKGPLPGKASVGGGAAVAQPHHVSDTTCQARALVTFPCSFFRMLMEANVLLFFLHSDVTDTIKHNIE